MLFSSIYTTHSIAYEKNERFLGFFFFINVSSFFIVNLVAAVLCESLIQISRGSKEEKTESNAEHLPKSESNREQCNDTTENINALEVMMQQILRNDAHMRASILELQEELRALRQTMQENGTSKQLHDFLPTPETKYAGVMN
jgi:hypothetical protein